jgi:hypothetical protein
LTDPDPATTHSHPPTFLPLCGGGPGWGEAALEQFEAAEGLRARMAWRLDAREHQIVTLRFGLGGDEPLTLKETGCRLGVTREWVRKLEVRAIHKLRDPDPGGGPAGEHDRGRARGARGA